MGIRFQAILAIVAVSFCFGHLQNPWDCAPWVSSNPNILSYGDELWWNIPELDKTLKSSSLDGAEHLQTSGAAEKALSDSMQAADKAGVDRELCYMEVLASIGVFPTVPASPFLLAFSKSSSCSAYERDWKGSVAALLDAVDETMLSADAAVLHARAQYDEIRFLGLCNPEYGGPGSEPCPELASAFASADGQIREGDYGKYALMRGEYEAIARNLKAAAPDLSPAPRLLGLAWSGDGAIASFGEAGAMAQSARKAGEAEYDMRLNAASARSSASRGRLEALDDDGLMAMDRAPASGLAYSPGTIKERLITLRKRQESLDTALSEAKLKRRQTNEQGYLAAAIILAKASEDGHLSLAEDCARLKSDAEIVLAQQRDDAQEQISSAELLIGGSPGPEASSLLEQARSAFAKGSAAGNSGAAFALYSKAAALARSAKGAKAFNETVQEASSLSELDSLISRAERDGIEVVLEKERLSLLRRTPPPDADSQADSAIRAIISKAEMKYGVALMDARKRILDKISLAGPDAADLFGELDRYEAGTVADGAIIYPDAIGSLKRLSADYMVLEGQADEYMALVVGNAMSASVQPSFGLVELDVPSDITLDIPLSNPRPYNVSSADVRVSIGHAIPLMYSDISSGKDGVEGVRSADGGKTVVLAMSGIKPYEVRRVIFQKSLLIARTIRTREASTGLGNGAALTAADIDFELDMDVPALHVADSHDSLEIDGRAAAGPLSEGRHSLHAERIVADAYSESVTGIRAYRNGVGSRVEYEIRILPSIDLDSVPITAYSMNSSEMLSFDIVSATGEPLKEKRRISGTEFYAKAYGLKKGREAVFRVSYAINDTRAYVSERLEELSAMNLSENAQSALADAERLHADGNDTQALGQIEAALAISRSDSKAIEKAEAKCRDMESALLNELAELGGLDAALAESPLIDRLHARRIELSRVLNATGGTDVPSRLAELEKIDLDWLPRELASMRKELYKEYGDLKERFFAAGNSTTPQSFIDFEESLNRLSSAPRVEYLVEAIGRLSLVEDAVAAQEESSGARKVALRSKFEAARSDLLETMDAYLRQASAAKGTDYSGLFTEAESRVERLAKDAEAASGGDPRIFESSIESMEKSRARMESTLSSLKNESEARLSMLESLLASSNAAEEAKKKASALLESARTAISRGDYVSALRTEKTASEGLEGEDEAGTDPLVPIAITAFAMLAALGFVLVRKPERKASLKKLTSFSGPAAPHPQGGRESAGPQSRSSPGPGRLRSPTPGSSISEGRQA